MWSGFTEVMKIAVAVFFSILLSPWLMLGLVFHRLVIRRDHVVPSHATS
jgi:hypothetical protein